MNTSSHHCIQLTPSEMMQAGLVGLMRGVGSIKAGKHHRFGADPENGWSLNIEGAMGEMAAAKVMRRYWSGAVNTYDHDDLDGIEVRTAFKHSHSLILHPTDPDDLPFVLVTGMNGEYKVQGFILAKNGKQQQFWRDPCGGRPAFFVPQSALQNIEEIHEYRTHCPDAGPEEIWQ